MSLPGNGDWSAEWGTADIAQLAGSRLPAEDPQLEAVCADGAGRLLLLQESPPHAELVDTESRRVVTSISLEVEGDGKFARSWADPQGSRGEGAVLLGNGHLLVAKEKRPAALIEFGPRGAASQGLARDRADDNEAAWPVEPGNVRFVALAVWFPDKALDKSCADFSDLEIGPDGRLYLLSDKSATIARLDELAPGGGEVTCTALWKLDGLDAKPEGLAFSATGQPIVALDKRKTKNNLVILEPAIAAAAGTV
jgi:hypothetical protein